MKDLINLLRSMSRYEHDDLSIGNEAADALEAQGELVKKWQGLYESVLHVAESVQQRAEAQQAEIEALKSIAYSDDGAGGECMKLYLEHRTMKAEIEALRADKDRLDWLEQNPRHAQIVVEGVPQSCVFYGITCSHLMKLREAIDSVRRE